MSEPVKVRPLFLYEKILDTSLVGSYMKLITPVELQAHHVVHALRMAKAEHPFLRMSIDEEAKCFVECPGDDVSLDVLEQLPDIRTQPESWKEKFLEIGRHKMDKKNTLFRATFSKHGSIDSESFSSSLFFFCNHCGTDGPSLLALCMCILKNLNQILVAEKAHLPPPPLPPSRQFLDILSKVSKDVAASHLPPDFPQEFVPPVSPERVPTFSDDDKCYVRSQFVKLTEQETENLVSNCRRDGYTVQSALSVAGMMAVLQHTHGASAARVKLLQGNADYTATFLNQVPANMRSRITSQCEGDGGHVQEGVVLSNEDCACCSAAVWWRQELKASTSLKEAAMTVYKEMHAALDRGDPIGWLARMNAGDFGNIRPYTIMTSSIGVSPPYRNCVGDNLIEVTDFWFLGSAEESSAKVSPGGGVMTHAYTFDGKMHMTFSYTSPHFNDSWGAMFVGEMKRILDVFIGGNTDETVMEYLSEK